MPPSLLPSTAAATAYGDATTNHVDVLLATLVVKINNIADITDVLSEKIEAAGSSTSESTCRTLSGIQAAEMDKLRAQLDELRGMLATQDKSLAALQPALCEDRRSQAAQLEHLERLVADRAADVVRRVESSHKHLVSHADQASASHSTHLDTRLERHVAVLTRVIEDRTGSTVDTLAKTVGRLIAEGEARSEVAFGHRLAALEAHHAAQAERTRTAIAERTEAASRQVINAQGPVLDAMNGRLDQLFGAVEGMQTRFEAALGSLAAQQAKDTAALRDALLDAKLATSQQISAVSTATEASRADTATALAEIGKRAEAARAGAATACDTLVAFQRPGDGGLAKLLAAALAPIAHAQSAAAEAAREYTQRAIDDAAAGYATAVARACEQQKAALERNAAAVAERTLAAVNDVLTADSQAAARSLAATASEIATQVRL